MLCDRDEVETVIESEDPSTANRRISSRKFFLKNFSSVSWKRLKSGGHKSPWSFRQLSMVRTCQADYQKKKKICSKEKKGVSPVRQ